MSRFDQRFPKVAIAGITSPQYCGPENLRRRDASYPDSSDQSLKILLPFPSRRGCRIGRNNALKPDPLPPDLERRIVRDMRFPFEHESRAAGAAGYRGHAQKQDACDRSKKYGQLSYRSEQRVGALQWRRLEIAPFPLKKP